MCREWANGLRLRYDLLKVGSGYTTCSKSAPTNYNWALTFAYAYLAEMLIIWGEKYQNPTTLGLQCLVDGEEKFRGKVNQLGWKITHNFLIDLVMTWVKNMTQQWLVSYMSCMWLRETNNVASKISVGILEMETWISMNFFLKK